MKNKKKNNEEEETKMKAENDDVEIEKEEEEEEEDYSNLELINYDKTKRLYGVKINKISYFATLVNLPCIIEAMKTLDNFNFYKSQDANQILYVHPIKVNLEELSPQELQTKINKFNAFKDDPDFCHQLYDRHLYDEFKKEENISNP